MRTDGHGGCGFKFRRVKSVHEVFQKRTRNTAEGFEKGQELLAHLNELAIFPTAEEIAEIDRKLDTITIPVFGGH